MKPKAKTQADKFKEAARELGCDDDEKRLDEAIRRLGKAPPPKADRPQTKKPAK